MGQKLQGKGIKGSAMAVKLGMILGCIKWPRLKPYEAFAKMIKGHWNGIAAYCNPENKIPLGFGEGLSDKIRVILQRAYGLRDEEYFRLKILTCMLPEIWKC